MECEIAVLIPCFNEEKTIKKVISDFLETLNNYNFKIYVYDNASNDNSAKLIKNFKNTKIIYKYVQKRGKGNVIKQMFEEIQADYYILIDGDDTYPVEKSVEMIELIKTNKFNMVVGDRLSGNFQEKNERLFHSFGNKLVTKLVNLFFNANLNDIMSGYRIFDNKLKENLKIMTKGFEIETEISIFAIKNNFKIKEIPIKIKNRPEGSKSKLNTYIDGFRVLRTILYFKGLRNEKDI